MGRKEKEVIGYRQLCIMQCIWEKGERITILELIDRLEEKCGQRFSAGSINSLVLKLVDKGFLEQSGKIHQAFTFQAAITEEEFQQQEIRRMEERTFRGKPSVLLTALLKQDISKEELMKMKEILEQIDE